MKINLVNRLLTVALVAGLMLGLVSVTLAQDPAPQTVVWKQSHTYYAGSGISNTETVTGTTYTFQGDFGIQDCYQIVDITDLQTVTGKIQHSPDGTNWVDNVSFSAVSADNVIFTRTTIYGTHERYWASLGTTNPVTIALKCVPKDN
jgi:hypothetical protein